MKKLILSFAVVFCVSSSIMAQISNQVIRVLNPNAENQTYVYDIQFDANQNAIVNRTTVSSIPSDSYGMYIIGNGWTFEQNILNLPAVPSKNWFKIDENFTGDAPIINGGSLNISCPCATEGSCTVNLKDNCVRCSKDQGCYKCDAPKAGIVIIPILIQANLVIINIY